MKFEIKFPKFKQNRNLISANKKPHEIKAPQKDNDIIWQDEKHGTFIDSRDGRKYKIVQINKQIWFAENLNFVDSIPHIADKITWAKLKDSNTDEAWCYYNNKIENAKTYGALYTYSAALKAVPKGWHLPSEDEWTHLTNFIENNIGTKLKAKSGWNNNGNGTDDYGFSALPGGYRGTDALFNKVGFNGYWWGSTEYIHNCAHYCNILYKYTNFYSLHLYKSLGFSVRCLRN